MSISCSAEVTKSLDMYSSWEWESGSGRQAVNMGVDMFLTPLTRHLLRRFTVSRHDLRVEAYAANVRLTDTLSDVPTTL